MKHESVCGIRAHLHFPRTFTLAAKPIGSCAVVLGSNKHVRVPEHKTIPFEKLGVFVQFQLEPFVILTMVLVSYQCGLDKARRTEIRLLEHARYEVFHQVASGSLRRQNTEVHRRLPSSLSLELLSDFLMLARFLLLANAAQEHTELIMSLDGVGIELQSLFEHLLRFLVLPLFE